MLIYIYIYIDGTCLVYRQALERLYSTVMVIVRESLKRLLVSSYVYKGLLCEINK